MIIRKINHVNVHYLNSAPLAQLIPQLSLGQQRHNITITDEAMHCQLEVASRHSVVLHRFMRWMPTEPNNKKGTMSRSNIPANISIVVIECGMMIWSYMDISAKNRTFVLFVKASLQCIIIPIKFLLENIFIMLMIFVSQPDQLHTIRTQINRQSIKKEGNS